MKNAYSKLTRLSLILVYLVILAGAVVRMTGSGMGCPDWPKCFGYYIPPTEEADLIWTPNKTFFKGQVIIQSESLWIAKNEIISGNTFNPENWEPYTRHDYAIFNAAHTWTEYINRLLGALAGLSVLAMAIASFAWWREKKSYTIAAWLAVLGMGFQAWLGATVVYSVLAPFRITLHMVMALLIVLLLIWLVFKTASPNATHKPDKILLKIWTATLILSLAQIILGTQVRQFIDHQADTFGEVNRELWLQNPTLIFYIHRSFSILLIVFHLLAAHRVYRFQLGYSRIAQILVALGVIVFSGIAMNYLGFPWGSQPLHLLLASVLFGLQGYLFLEIRNAWVTRISS
ncbi:COX15/CtaA family protein [Robiginitalea sp.]|nr:COX15/CtaA family protein [Robiginitalea sp.]